MVEEYSEIEHIIPYITQYSGILQCHCEVQECPTRNITRINNRDNYLPGVGGYFFSDYNHEGNNYIDLGTRQMGIFIYDIVFIDKE